LAIPVGAAASTHFFGPRPPGCKISGGFKVQGTHRR
jgi:hypothetical protein